MKSLAKRLTIERKDAISIIGPKDLMDRKRKKMLYRAGSSLSKSFFIVANKVKGIVKVFDVIPSIPFWAVLFLAH